MHCTTDIKLQNKNVDFCWKTRKIDLCRKFLKVYKSIAYRGKITSFCIGCFLPLIRENAQKIWNIQRYAIITECNGFRGDIFLDSFCNASRDEDNILDQIYIKKICSDFYYGDIEFSWHYTKMHTNIGVPLKPNFMSSLF